MKFKYPFRTHPARLALVTLIVLGAVSVVPFAWKYCSLQWLTSEVVVAGGAIDYVGERGFWDRTVGRKPKYGATNVHLQKTKVDTHWFDRHRQLTTLTRLNLLLNDTAVNDETLELLIEFHNLVGLGLDGTLVTDEGLKHLKAYKSLKRLRLTGTEISDAGLVYLEQLDGLVYVNLYDTNVTEGGVAKLKRALPGVTINHVTEFERPAN